MGKRIICVSGGADCLHIGHINMINDAYEYGKVIWVLNSDEWLKKKKGYVVMPFEERKKILLSLKKIYAVEAVDDKDGTIVSALNIIRPSYFGNGGDIKIKDVPEAVFCEKNNIELVFDLGGNCNRSSREIIDNVALEIIKRLEKWK